MDCGNQSSDSNIQESVLLRLNRTHLTNLCAIYELLLSTLKVTNKHKEQNDKQCVTHNTIRRPVLQHYRRANHVTLRKFFTEEM
jgi:hypothetical protein